MNNFKLSHKKKLEIINTEINTIDDLHKIMKDALLYRESYTDYAVTDIITLLECINQHTKKIYSLF